MFPIRAGIGWSGAQVVHGVVQGWFRGPGFFHVVAPSQHPPLDPLCPAGRQRRAWSFSPELLGPRPGSGHITLANDPSARTNHMTLPRVKGCWEMLSGWGVERSPGKRGTRDLEATGSLCSPSSLLHRVTHVQCQDGQDTLLLRILQWLPYHLPCTDPGP